MSRKRLRGAFTLIEILIATSLLSIVLIGLYESLDTQRRSVEIIRKSLDTTMSEDKFLMVLYNDIAKSDGNITINKGERDRVCIQNTTNSIYGLDSAKVCWLVLKDKDSLVRVEGGDYKLPVEFEGKVEVDIVTKGIKLFEISRNEKDGYILVVIQQLEKEPYSFLLQGIKPPPNKKIKSKKDKNRKNRRGKREKDNNKTSKN
jgi:prepilin-type N-terminal cleavage/methylation domain-containing protein